MKQIALIFFLLTFAFANANDSGKNPLTPKKEVKKESSSEFSNSSVSASDLEALDFSVDAIFKNVTFTAANKIDFINIYDENNQEIFSATGSILKTDTLNISFLEKGTYYLEVVVNDTIGAKKIIL